MRARPTHNNDNSDNDHNNHNNNDDDNDKNNEGNDGKGRWMMGATTEGAGAVAAPVAEATPAPPAQQQH